MLAAEGLVDGKGVLGAVVAAQCGLFEVVDAGLVGIRGVLVEILDAFLVEAFRGGIGGECVRRGVREDAAEVCGVGADFVAGSFKILVAGDFEVGECHGVVVLQGCDEGKVVLRFGRAPGGGEFKVAGDGGGDDDGLVLR